jgi:hypothetical protein
MSQVTSTVSIMTSTVISHSRFRLQFFFRSPARTSKGGEFVLTEQRPRMESRAEVVPLCQGDAVAFAVHNRPVQGSKGNYRVNLRHGVSRVRSGSRRGIIFHDAR